jgi:ABC-2 type transport system permease protein
MFKAMLVKEILLILRDKHALAALFVMPAIFILIMSIALKDTFSTDRPLLHYALVDEDISAASKQLGDFLSTSQVLVRHDVTIPDAAARTRLLNSSLQLVLTVPQGFAQKLRVGNTASLLRLDIAADTREELLTVFQARLATDILRLRLATMEKELAPFVPDVAKKLREADYSSTFLTEMHYTGGFGIKKPNSTQQSVPSWIVFGMFFVIIPLSTVFVNERRQNTLKRMSAMNVSVPLLFFGKLIPYMLINQLQVVLMIAVGMFLVPLLGGDALTPGHSLFGLGMVSLGLSLAATGTSLLIAVFARTVEQATTVGGLLNILFGAIGGVMVPKFYMPAQMQNFAAVSPMSWGLEGFLDVFLRGLGAADVLAESLALAGFGMVMITLAAMVLRYQMKRGR